MFEWKRLSPRLSVEGNPMGGFFHVAISDGSDSVVVNEDDLDLLRDYLDDVITQRDGGNGTKGVAATPPR